MKRLISLVLVFVILSLNLSVIAENGETETAISENEEVVSFREEFFEKVKWLQKEEHPGYKKDEADKLSLFASEYSEVVYIKTADDLMDIDGHDGGYYEFKNDIDITGIEWNPVNLTNATINGNGFSVIGLTVKDEPDYVENMYNGDKTALVGLFDSTPDHSQPKEQKGIYITNLHLKNVNIDIEKVNNGRLVADPFDGGYMTYLDECSVSGKMDVRIVRGSADVCGIEYGDNCSSDLNITVRENISSPSENHDIVSVCGVRECDNSTFSGDLKVESDGYADSVNVYCMEGTFNCETDGDVTVTSEGENYAYVNFMQNSDECVNNGNVNIERVGESYANIEIIGESENCINYGEVKVSGYNTNFISYSDGCKNYGDIYIAGSQSSCNVIYYSSNCDTYGKVYLEGENADLTIIAGSENCHSESLIETGENESAGITFISNSSSCSHTGDFIGKGNDICGIGSSDNCVVSSNIEAQSVGSMQSIASSYSCVYKGDISVEQNNGMLVDMLIKSDNCVFEGNVIIKGGWLMHVIAGSNNCVFEGDISVESASNTAELTAIDESNNCVFEGNIENSGGLDTHLIAESSNCVFKGDLTSFGRGVCALKSSDNCVVEGNINNIGYYEYFNAPMAISNSSNCAFKGNITASLIYRVIDNSTDCYMIGNITAEDGIYCVMERDVNCSITGNITAEGAVCMSYCTNCFIDGNVSTRGSVYGIGISAQHCYDCYITGTLSASTPDGFYLAASASSPFQGVLQCSRCGVKNVLSNAPHYHYNCYNDGIDGSYVILYYAEYGISYSTGGGTGGNPGETPTSEPAETPTPEPEDDSDKIDYTLCIIDEKSDKPVEGAKVSVDGKEYKSDANGVVSVTDGKKSCGIKVELAGKELYTNAHFTPRANSMNTIKITPMKLDVEDFNLGKSDKANVTGPNVNIAGKNTPLFDIPFDMELNLFDAVKTAYNAEKKQVEVLLGTGSKLEDLKEDATDATWETIMEDYVRHWERFGSGDFDDGYINEMNSKGTESARGKFGVEGSVSVEGFLNISLDEETMGDVNGGMTVVVSGSLEKSFCYPAMPLVYVVFGISGELGAGLEYEIISSSVVDPYLDVCGALFGSLTPKVGVGAGIRGVAALEVGIEGELGATAQLPFESAVKSLEVTLTGTVYGLVSLLGQEFKTQETLTEAILYPTMSMPALMNVESEEKMSVVKRDYGENVTLFSEKADTVKSNIYPYSQVQLAQLSDGRVIMAWLDDDIERSLANKTAIYYSILQNGVWSEPLQIANDKTADFEFDLRSKGTKAAIVWQNTIKSLPDAVSLSETAGAIELCYAEFDGNSWSEPIAITTENTDYEYSPKMYYDGYTAQIIWTQNKENSVMRGTEISGETVYKKAVTSGICGVASVAYDNLPYIYETTVSQGGNTAVIADKDGNVNTNDAVLYCNGDLVSDNGKPITALNSDGSLFYYCQEGKIYRYYPMDGSNSIVYDSKGNINSIYIVKNPANYSDMRFIFEQSDGFASNLYMASAGKKAVPITDNDEKIRAWDAIIDSNGQLNVASVMANIKVDASSLSQTARLAYTKTEPIENITVNYIAPKGELKRGKNGEFAVSITNNTASVLSSVNICLTGDKAGEILPVAAQTVAIPMGETREITVKAFIPVDLEKQNITATVSSDSVNESNIDDNSASVEVGKADLCVSVNGDRIHSGGYIEANVENKGFETASEAVLTLSDESGKVLITKELNDVSGGEKRNIKFDVKDIIPSFTDEYDKYLIKAEVKSTLEEDYLYNNEDGYFVRPQSAMIIMPEVSTIRMFPGDISKLNAKFYPVPDFTPDIYMISDNEEVVKITEDGKLEAVGYGTAKVTLLSTGTYGTTVEVTVGEPEAPEISSVNVYDNGRNGQIELVINTKECLAEGEKAVLYVAGYDEKGRMVMLNETEVTASEYNYVYLQYEDIKPATVKIMIWNGAEGQKPVAKTCETEIVYPVYDPTPVVGYANFIDNSTEDKISGTAEIMVDLTHCPDLESAKIFVAAYAEDGSLINVVSPNVSKNACYQFLIPIEGKRPKSVKIMLWDGLAKIMPVSEFAEGKF